MSQFYDSASLVMVPSGYKSGKIYSQKPLSTSGELSFSRASNATRVNSAGLIEKVRTNLITYSNTFSNAAWSQTYVPAPTANAIANPLTGAVDAWKLVEDGTNNFHYILQTPTFAAGEVSFSFYAKSAERTTCSAFLSQGGNVGASFNLSTGVATASGTGNTASMVSVGGGWYRCIVTNNGSATVANQVRIGVADGALSSYAGDGTSGIYIYAAQAEQGVATDYIATTSAAVSVGATANTPRLDYSGGCPSLLLEPQRTSLVKFSESFDNAAWNNTSYPVTITANQTASPTGYVDGDLITPTAASSRHAVGQTTISATAGVTYTISAFFKKAASQYVVLSDAGDSNWHIVTADLNAGTITNETNATGTITNYSNGWYRVTCTFTRVNTSSIHLYVGASNVSNASSLPSFNDVTLTTYVWGCQAEQGSYATSYIGPTYSSAVTRVADSASKTGISSLIGQTEGTLFAEMEAISGIDTIGIWLRKQSTGLYGDFIVFQINNALQPRLEIYAGGVAQGVIFASPLSSAGYHKVAIAYKANDFVMYVDGVQVGADTSGSVPTCDEIYIDQYIDGGIRNATKKQALLFKTRLSNADLATLTTL